VKKLFRRRAKAFFLTFWLLPLVLPAQLHAQIFKVLHTFTGPDGAQPLGTLSLDNAGDIYGTTGIGGSGTKCPNFSNSGCGTAFMLNEAGEEVGLYSFNGANGAGPYAGLFRDASGNFFGTTIAGGTDGQACGGVQGFGCGVAFRLSKTGKEIAYKFKGTPDGYAPESLLTEDAEGNLLGTTYQGGANALGAVFKIDAKGNETILHSFAGPPEGGGDGAFSYEGVIMDAAGNLYGVTFGGGAYGAGVVYELGPGGEETLLYSFTGLSDGSDPDSVLLLDSQGNLYGTTEGGGSSPECFSITGCGVVFELSPQPGGSWKETVLYTFCSLSDCTDGQEPGSGPLVRDSAGKIYGTTYLGGVYRNCNGDACGVVFELDATGKETVLHSFTGGSDGANPVAGLTKDGSAGLYGTTQQGGATCFPSLSCGVVFKITP
jgi:uncharacterized repeat protein (TIGR03803 family)